MVFSPGYLFRETRNNLRWNITLVLATVVAVWVSLTLFGASLIIRQGVQQATQRWQGGIEFIVFMNADATPDQMASLETSLRDNPEVDGWDFFNKEAAFNEFVEAFSDQPELIDSVTKEDLPPSFRVRPAIGDADAIQSLAESFENYPGVRQITLPLGVIRTLQESTQQISVFVLILSVVVLVAALMLIANTIRTAIFARRQDIEVMKLVGASNWYIRLPFMTEGVVQGLLGGLLAVPMLFLMNRLLAGFVQEDFLQLLRSLVLESSSVWGISFLVMGIGAGMGALASLFAAGRFLDV